MAISEKPTVREAVAVALSGGSLDRAAALGSAQLLRDDDGLVVTVHDEAGLGTRERSRLVQRNGEDLGLELAALLLRAKYAQDHRGVKAANFKFAARLRVRAKQQARAKLRYDNLIIALASQSIAEWLADRCERCKGTGIFGARMGGMDEFLRPCAVCRDLGGKPTGVFSYTSSSKRPNGSTAPNAKFRDTELGRVMLAEGMGEIEIQCPACRGMRYVLERKRVHQRFGRICQACAGEGEAPPRHADRARALGITLENYGRCWHRWFDWAGGHLTVLDKTLIRNLRCELGRGYSPPS